MGALSDPEVGRFFGRHFVAAHEQVGEFELLRGLFGTDLKIGGNVASYFCTPDRRVIHAVLGPVTKEILLAEAQRVIDIWSVVADKDFLRQQEYIGQAHSMILPSWIRQPDARAQPWEAPWSVTPSSYELHLLLSQQPLAPLADLHRMIFEDFLGERVTEPALFRQQTQKAREAAEATGRPLVFSPDGALLVSGDRDGTIRVWNVDTALEERTLRGHLDQVLRVSFSPDGCVIASGDRLGTVKGWDLRTGASLWTLAAHGDEITSMAFAPDSASLATGSFDTTVKLWNLESGQVKRTIRPRLGGVSLVAFSPDRNTLAASNGQATKYWNVRRCLQTPPKKQRR